MDFVVSVAVTVRYWVRWLALVVTRLGNGLSNYTSPS